MLFNILVDATAIYYDCSANFQGTNNMGAILKYLNDFYVVYETVSDNLLPRLLAPRTQLKTKKNIKFKILKKCLLTDESPFSPFGPAGPGIPDDPGLP